MRQLLELNFPSENKFVWTKRGQKNINNFIIRYVYDVIGGQIEGECLDFIKITSIFGGSERLHLCIKVEIFCSSHF